MTVDFKVGAVLWYVPSQRYGSARLVTIEKVGRVWATFDRGLHRARTVDGYVDGGEFSSPGTLWPSEAEHTAHVARALAWERFCNQLHGFRFVRVIPELATVENIAKCRELLGIPEKP